MKKTPNIQDNDVQSFLRDYCGRSTPTAIRPMADSSVFSATFANCSTNALTFDVLGNPPVFPTSGTCSVFFVDGATGYHFMASVLEQPASTQAMLTMPTQITVERRSSLRVPINSGLCVQLTTNDGRVRSARPLDLSLSGMFVEFTSGEDLGLSVDERITVELWLACECTRLTGWIRSHAGNNNCGVAFSPDSAATEAESLVDLQRLYATLRQQRITSNVVKTACLHSGTVAVPIPNSNA